VKFANVEVDPGPCWGRSHQVGLDVHAGHRVPRARCSARSRPQPGPARAALVVLVIRSVQVVHVVGGRAAKDFGEVGCGR